MAKRHVAVGTVYSPVAMCVICEEQEDHKGVTDLLVVHHIICHSKGCIKLEELKGICFAFMLISVLIFSNGYIHLQ